MSLKNRIFISAPLADGQDPSGWTSSGQVVLFSRDDAPVAVSGGAEVVSPGGTLAVAAGGVVDSWVDVPVHVEAVCPPGTGPHADHFGHITVPLWANAGGDDLPLQHLLIDGFDGSYYVWNIEFRDSSGTVVQSATNHGQLSATIDYGAEGLVTVDGAVFADALNLQTLSTGHIEAWFAKYVNRIQGWPILEERLDDLDVSQAEQDGRLDAFDGVATVQVEHGSRLDGLEANDAVQDTQLDGLAATQTSHEERLDDLGANDAAQDQLLETHTAELATHETRLNDQQAHDATQDARLDDADAGLALHDVRLDTLDSGLAAEIAATDAEQNYQDGRLDGLDAEQDVQDGRLHVIEEVQTVHDGRLDGLDAGLAAEIASTDAEQAIQDSRLDGIDAEQATQDSRLDGLDAALAAEIAETDSEQNAQDSRLDGIDQHQITQDGRLDGLDAEQTAQDGRLDGLDAALAAEIASTNTEQATQNSRLDTIDQEQDVQDSRLDGLDSALAAEIASTNAEQIQQNTRLDGLDAEQNAQDARLNGIDAGQATQNGRLNTLEDRADVVDTEQATQDGRLDGLDAALAAEIASTNTEQATQNSRLTSLEGRANTTDTEQAAQDTAIDDNTERIGAVTARAVAPSAYGFSTTASAAANSLSLQQAYDDARAAGAPLVISGGTYNISSTLTSSESFYHSSIRGAGGRYTILNKSNPGAAIKFIGGSGALCLAEIADIGFTGATATGIELSGVGGVTMRRLEFDTLAGGVLFHNEKTASFTEFCVLYDSNIKRTTTPIEYRRGSGHDSFHGSGFENTVMVQFNAASLIKLGSGVRVYNAPWDGTLFGGGSGGGPGVIISTTIPVQIHGNIRAEALTQLISDSATAYVYHSGKLTTLGPMVLTQRYRSVEASQSNADGTISTAGEHVSAIADLDNSALPGTSVCQMPPGASIVHVYVVGPFYFWNSLLYVSRSRFNSGGTVVQLAQGEISNQAGHGAPVYTVTNYRLHIGNTNYPATGVRAEVVANSVHQNAGPIIY